ncbi:PQQ-binding-like beta-propeller repeat protein [Methanocella sp.]|uniref:outer membrane protein assembly factor BamB family protein n=1 Tax=Methanocella sp. TaxID=2052833 RepID=UPI002D80CE78|nr:PQQ-binding-like beta-propeller repeat protein [Methanocella sp.]
MFESLLAIAAILLIFSFYLMVTGYAFTTTQTNATVKWDAPGNGSIYYLKACQDGTLRALMDGRVSATGSDGSPLWSVDIPDRWWVGSKYYDPAVDVAPDGTLYVYLRANVTQAAMERRLPYTYAGDTAMDMDDQNKRLMDAYAGTEFAYSLDERVLAISPNGSILWNVPLSTGLYDADIVFRNDTVYVYHGYEETALDADGRILWTAGDVGAAPAVDEDGYVYAMTPVHSGELDPNRRALSGIITALYPDGTIFWRQDIGEAACRWKGTVPLYNNGTLYLPLNNGIAAMDRSGTVLWTKHYNVSTAIFEQAPFDSAGNIYLRTFDAGMSLSEYTFNGETYYSYIGGYQTRGSHISILRPDGTELASIDGSREYVYVNDGIAYQADVLYPENERRLGVLESAVLKAIDLKGNRTIWSHSISPGEAAMATLNASSAESLLTGNDLKNAAAFNAHGSNFTPQCVCGDCSFRIIQGKDVTYVGFWTYNYEAPAIYGLSKVAYSGGLYAFDRAGNLLWSRPVDSIIGSMYEKDGTIYYSTGNGRMSAASIDFVTGLAMAAALYILIRFVAVGAVSRARGAVSKNENRNVVLQYIVEHPGSTMYEIARSLELNKGTVRYHLFILSVNHRIASIKADKKFVRYFPNAGSYSKDEQLLMSLLRRDTIRRVMEALLRKPGLSNVQLSAELKVPESAMSKHMKELCMNGIVDRLQQSGGVSYRIRDDMRGPVARALERMAV